MLYEIKAKSLQNICVLFWGLTLEVQEEMGAEICEFE